MSRRALSFPRLGANVAGVAVIALCSLAAAIGVTFIGASLLAVAAFANGTAINIPLVASFRGFVDSNGSRAVVVNGSWAAASVLVVLLAAPLPIVAMTRHRDRP